MPLQRTTGPLFQDGSLTQSKFIPDTITWTSNASLSSSTVIAENSRVLELTAANVTYSSGALYTDYITGPNESAGLSLSANNSGTINYVIDRFRFTLDAAVMIPIINTARVVYQYTGDIQTFVVPAGITCIFAKMWGGGGGTGIPGAWSYGAEGAGGGFSQGIIPVVPGETLSLVVGRGGTTCNTSTPIYGGGGLPGIVGGVDPRYAGTGGGLAGIFGASASLTVDVLIVAGGGGGGMDMGGGGGAGGVLEYNNVVITPNVYSINVGAGGAGAPAASTNGQPGAHQYSIPATQGGNSSALGYTAIGGGTGGSSYYLYSPGATGGNGGSGGGTSGYSNGTLRNGGTATAGQGYNGGRGGGQYYSGGGGGAGGPGVDSPARSDGGPGKISTILGTSYYWGGGGGGSGYSIGGGNGGLGGGGGGAVLTTTGGTGGINNGAPGGGGAINIQCNTPGGAGGANTGGGGGGGSHYSSNNYGGTGGSGIVIIRYLGAQQAWGGDSVYQTTIGGQVYTIHQFRNATTSNFYVGGFGPLLIAGGGGGGGSGLDNASWDGWADQCGGGAGGGLEGCRGEITGYDRYDNAGTGGTQTAGGYAPIYSSTPGQPGVGSMFQGGNTIGASYGGAGGGGYWGGGAGYYNDPPMPGGGGGSGYVHSSVIMGGTYAGCFWHPSFFWDSDLNVWTNSTYTKIAYGGNNTNNNQGADDFSGGHAYVAIWALESDVTQEISQPAIQKPGAITAFTSIGKNSWVAPYTGNVEVLAVGGGGGGGGSYGSGGGGGAGGVVYIPSYPVVRGTRYNLTVGRGGYAGIADATNTGTTAFTQGRQGTNSDFAGFVAIGGGGGNESFYTTSVFKNGGSGGGGGDYYTNEAYVGGLTIQQLSLQQPYTTTITNAPNITIGAVGYGNVGGTRPSPHAVPHEGAGGGGAGGAGYCPTACDKGDLAGFGGIGIRFDQFAPYGTPGGIFGGGGGGGIYTSSGYKAGNAARGGPGGGGNGAIMAIGQYATNATNSTGGGGGGGSWNDGGNNNSPNLNAGLGGDGIVLIKNSNPIFYSEEQAAVSNSGADWKDLKVWRNDNTSRVNTVSFDSYILSGPYYYTWRVFNKTKNTVCTKVSGQFQRQLSDFGNFRFTGSVHAYSTQSMTGFAVDPGDELTLQLNGSNGAGTVLNNNSQVLYVKNLYVFSGGTDATAYDTTGALGGDVIQTSSSTIHVFKNSGTLYVNEALPSSRYLVVAGGGGGGADMGGGGGAGGVLAGTTADLQANTDYTISVGAGGTGAPPGHGTGVRGTNGGNSSIAGTGVSIIATGGGAAGSSFNSAGVAPGVVGGSGGGASGYRNVEPVVLGGAGTAGQGNAGGNQGSQHYSGGGGGAAGTGGSGNNQANGGAGSYNDIMDQIYYWGGGGGGAGYSIAGGNGGQGGGGAGAIGIRSGGGDAINPGESRSGGGTGTTAQRIGGYGGRNTGGGGGGGSHQYGNTGGAGGSGIVIISYNKGWVSTPNLPRFTQVNSLGMQHSIVNAAAGGLQAQGSTKISLLGTKAPSYDFSSTTDYGFNTHGGHGGVTNFPMYWAVYLGTTPQAVNEFKVTVHANCWGYFELAGSNDAGTSGSFATAGTWTNLTFVTSNNILSNTQNMGGNASGYSDGRVLTFTYDNNIPYTHYRVKILDSSRPNQALGSIYNGAAAYGWQLNRV